ncbi:FtsH protease activity modulator HflK [Paracoccus sediminicola]|uniref:FtsH protease activity modulator HflK n=1 Tax=Paracoccus sediminicola TaxID=3017783 RepID=UPI0022F00813|nr:FtsH protease activity modulator HflK [Paracoccus sediminicola]WBU58149.1 FtsH protease activity modulator HflK [Paracoccus sediminicola]
MAQGPWGGGSSGGNGGGSGGGKGGKEPPRGPQRPWGQGGGQGGGQGEPGRQRPEPPRRPGQRPGDLPEIEDLMKKGQDRLRVLMGGRGNGGSNGGGPRRPGGPGFSFDRRTLVIGAIALLGAWTVASFYTVKPEERSVEFLFGRAVGTGEPGLNFAPWPVVTKEVVQVTGERVTEIGTGRVDTNRQGDSVITPTDSGLMLTRDQNIVDMEYQVVWNISDPQKYLFNLADAPGTIRAVAESSMRDIIARSELAPILNRERGAIAEDLEISVQRTLDSYQSGINIVRVNLDRADPPEEVIDSFRQVQAAQQRRDALEKQADAYANEVLAKARGDAAAAIERAEGYRAEAINNAQGESARFNSVYAEYAKAPEVTRKRMYLETMEQVLGRVDKVIIDGAGSDGVVPYLPLDQIRRPAGSSGSGNPSSATGNNTNSGSAGSGSSAAPPAAAAAAAQVTQGGN